MAGGERLIAAEDAGRYRDALGAMPPSGLPDAYLDGGEDPLGWILPLPGAAVRSRPRRSRALRARPPAGRGDPRGLDLVRGELRPGGTGASGATPTCCAACGAPASRGCARRSSPPTRARSGVSAAWQGVDRRATLGEALVPLQGLSLPVALWEGDLLPRRVPGYQAAWLDQLTASGEVVWVGAGLERVALYFREDAAALGRPGALPPPDGEAHEAIREALSGGALFWFDLVTATGLEASHCPRSGISSGRVR